MTTGILGREFTRKGIGMSSEAARRFTDDLHDIDYIRLDPINTRQIQDLYDRHQPNISGAECLYAFFGHLCNLSEPIVLSKKHNLVRIHDLIDQFCKLNNIPDPEPGWEKRLNPAFYKETTTMDGNCIMHQQPLSLCSECKDNQVNDALMDKNETIKALRQTLIEISVEDCSCTRAETAGGLVTQLTRQEYQCPRCRALEVLESTKNG